MSGGIPHGSYDTSSFCEDGDKKYIGIVVSTHNFQKHVALLRSMPLTVSV